MARALTGVEVPAGDDVVHSLLPRLAAALDGSGPAVLPLPPDPAQRERVVAALRPDDPAAPLERDDVALVVPTTGSTGEPKGALLTAAALTASGQATHDRLGGPGRWLLAMPATHIAGLQVLLRSLLAGTTPTVLDLADGFTAEGFVSATEHLRSYGSSERSYTALVPTQLSRVLASDAGARALASYDAVLLGGAAAPAPLLEQARSAGVRVLTTYGMSETCGGCVYDGQPLDGVEVEIGDDGRIRLGGPTVFAGYRLRPDLTATALVDGRHVTNDLGRLRADGTLEVLGRADDVVVTGGEKVALPLVEAALLTHPGVREAAATAVPDPEWGQKVVAVVVADPAPTLQDLRATVAARAGRVAAPRALVVVDALPLTANGKVDRRALPHLVIMHEM
ncbi:MAG TPA: o-succinylbenzoate--CoA ligase [Motilibacteraceae bacterium]|nr:o-succinylbenzoate--CoA ligase [Motilibacteraceae bacterium]